MDRGTEHAHAFHVGVLALYIRGSHEDLTLHVHQGTNGCGSHTMLAGTGLCNDTCLAHLLSHEDLTYRIVDLMGAGVVQVLALQVKLTVVFLAHPLGEVEGRGAPDIVSQQLMVFFLEFFRLDDGLVCLL